MVKNIANMHMNLTQKYSSKMVLALFMMKVGTLRQFVRKTCFCRKLEIVRWMNL